MSNGQLKFNCIQISDFLDVLEKYGIEPGSIGDHEASNMFSELLLTIVRKMDKDQAKEMWDNV